MWLFRCKCGTELLLMSKVPPVCRRCGKQMKRERKKPHSRSGAHWRKDEVAYLNTINGE